MPVTFRRLYGWNGEEWIPVVVDEDGHLIADSDSEATVGGRTFQHVSDMNANETLSNILSELKKMNLHLQAITDEEIKNDY
jgi:hypothetical protein